MDCPIYIYAWGDLMSELCLKNETVITFKDINGVPGEIIKVNTPELLPVCLSRKCDMATYNKWMASRCIPDTREGLKEIKEEFGDQWMSCKNFASLTDHYWLKKRTENWRKINFFTNIYPTDIGNMMFSPWMITKPKIGDSPDHTTNGVLRKRWLQKKDCTSRLVKAGSKVTHQEPLNEVLVSVLAEQLKLIPAVKYDLFIEGVTMCSVCDNFVTQDTELVPATHIYFLEEKTEGETVYEHLLRMCDRFEIPGVKEYLDGMIFIDRLTANEDRNLSNIGFIRDVNTMKFLGPAPLYDSGNAYWNTKKINDTTVSAIFGDVEEEIFKRLRKQHDLENALKKSGYKKIIYNYPCITNVKKENLIEAITKLNNRLCKAREFIPR